HDLWFQLQVGAAECATLAAEHALADGLIEEGLAHAAAVPEQVPFYVIAIMASAGRGLHPEAIRRGQEGLRLLGMNIGQEDLAEPIAEEKERARTARAQEPIEVACLPDPREDAQLMLLLTLIAPAWYADAELLRLISARAARMSLEHGAAPAAATAC